MMHIPYKPLSERMFHEPFWLGLMTVFFVMGVIGLVWCAKRHFPEKIEKLLAEDNDRNRSTMSSLRSTSVREQLAAASAAATGGSTVPVAPSPGPGAPRSLFGRLGIRKPSILSLTSPHASGYVPATARTFSLDDLLKPPPRRSPSPKKKRNNSTPSKKNVAEKKQILQHLISPGNKHSSRKVSLGELIQMTERAPKGGEDLLLDNSPTAVLETKFLESDPVQSALNDPKLEKKVTFARLLNKVSAEMSSGSDIELGIMQTNKLGCMFARPSSTPPSPTVDVRSPNSTSSNQGSDSLTSSDFAISVFSSSISDLLNNRRHSRLPNGRQKPASADSILAMFKNFSSSSASANLPSSLRVSPSTTPTASSPQDDIAGDDESSTSSIPTPVSFSSGPPESPIMHRSNQNNNSIEVPVLDTLSAHKSPNSGSNFLHPPTILLEIPSTINKCLSPIREMPTPLPSPMPSPAFTPIMRRSTASSSIEDADISDDRISIDLPNISINCSDLDEDELDCTDIVIDPQAEDGLILEEAAAMQQNSFYRIKNQRPPPLGQLSDISGGNIKITVQPPPLEIPILIIQTPSPTHTVAPSALFPGSPPPRSFKESCFQFPSPKQTRKMYKDFDKPTSLDLPCAPPMITITCNMSEAESDIDSISPAVKAAGHLGVGPSGMSYLSPFSMVARGDHNASESNLSSSGYSSMASPGPSRCGSSNPLCPSEMEDPGPGGSQRRMSLTPILKPSSTTEDSENKNKTEDQRRGRSDSETLSDDPLLESNDEGIGTDHLDEKIEDGEVKSAKELEVFIGNDSDSSKTVCDVPMLAPPRAAKSVSLDITIDRLLPPPPGGCNFKNSLQLPSIVVQCDSPGGEKMLSPMSSRSESPLSDRMTGVSRFSPQFYGRNKDLLPFTDSDGLYDFPSSDKVNVTTVSQHKKTSKKRDKKLLRNCKTPSPTKPFQSLLLHNHLDVPTKDSYYKVPAPRKLSPKRRVVRSQVVSSSSSSDSINSAREIRLSSSSPSPDTIRWSSPVNWLDEKSQKSHEASSEETCDDANAMMLPKPHQNAKHQKISRLRAISHQIRFLRRLELSLKRRERTVSPSDSLDSGEESPRATSPLLSSSRSGSKVEIRKSSSIGKLQVNNSAKTRRIKYKRGEYLLQPDDKSWKKVVITGNGHSD
ncbi:unnamed protein product [Brassicogethes aeneus]|uniref:Uncharacterized protein n=1 Tax=Brassicogethes aeneus TaxID=1431903 RepID=A0A9P0ASH1_BRAAE|nr:unnamed protein product [Brassicogethes aeneus]